MSSHNLHETWFLNCIQRCSYLIQMENRKEYSYVKLNAITEQRPGVAKSYKKDEKGKRGKKPGRKPSSSKVDMRIKLERSRQSARECRARKKLRYQYLEELVSNREKAVLLLKKELQTYRNWAQQMDAGHIPEELKTLFEEEKKQQQQATKKAATIEKKD